MSLFTSARRAASDVYAALRRRDGWENVLTGLGSLSDKLRWHKPTLAAWADYGELDAAYHQDDMTAFAVEALPELAFSRGWELAFSGELDADELAEWVDVISKEQGRLRAREKLLDTICWGRLDGRGGLLLGADDGQDMRMPLRPERLRRLLYVDALEALDFQAHMLQGDLLAEDYGEPVTWLVSRGGTGQQVEVHSSRLILARGMRTKRQTRMSRGWRDVSVVDRAMSAIRAFDSGHQTAAHMLQDASQAVMKIDGFLDLLAGPDEGVFAERMQLIQQGRSVASIIPVDADKEEMTHAERSFSGVSDMLDRLQVRLGAALRAPTTVIMGRSPAGENSTGDADLTNWYGRARELQRNVYGPMVERLVQLIAYAVGAPEPELWTVTWPNLWEETSLELAARQKAVAEVDAIYIDRGVSLPEEVALARFGGSEWSDRMPQIDTELRQAMLEAELKRAEEEATKEPEPVPPQFAQAQGEEPPPAEGDEEPEPPDGEEPEPEDEEEEA